MSTRAGRVVTRIARLPNSFQLQLRAFVWLCVCALTVCIAGCATATVGASIALENSRAAPVESTDTIVALGKPTPEFAKALGHSDAVAFLGKTQTYFAIEGGEKLMALIQLNPDWLRLRDRPVTLDRDDEAFWGTVVFEYAPKGTQAIQSNGQVELLRQIGFKQASSNLWLIEVAVKGKIYPAIPVQGSGMGSLVHERRLTFRHPKERRYTGWFGLGMLPAALILDAILLPAEVAGVAVFAITHSSSLR